MTAAVHDQHLAICADHLRAALTGEKIVFRAMQALRHLMAAVAPGYALNSDLAGEVSRMLFLVAPRLSEAVAGRIAPEHIFFALGCANNAMTCTTAPRCWDLVVYTSVLETDLKALLLRDMIMEGGQVDLAHMLARSSQAAPSVLAAAPSVH